MKKFAVGIMLIAILLGGLVAANAAPNLYGVSGLIETPDDSITAQGNVAVTVKDVPNFQSSNRAISFGGNIGLLPKLEVGAVGVDSNAPGEGTEVLLNGKFKLLSETVATPSVTVGIVDAANQLSHIGLDRHVSDPSAFLVIGKNLTGAAEKVTGGIIKPLKVTAGLGTGLYKGVFVGMNYHWSARISVMAEYLSNGIRQESTANMGLRWNPVGGLSVEAGTIGFDNFYCGANYVLATH